MPTFLEYIWTGIKLLGCFVAFVFIIGYLGVCSLIEWVKK